MHKVQVVKRGLRQKIKIVIIKKFVFLFQRNIMDKIIELVTSLTDMEFTFNLIEYTFILMQINEDTVHKIL